MKISRKTSLMIIALALLVCLVWLGSRRVERDEPVAASVSDTSQGPFFEVHVVRPLSARPLFGLFGLLPDNELRFNNTSGGAEIGSIGPNHLGLKAEGWDLFIEIDSEGRITPKTRLLFPIELGGRQVRLHCRPADRATGYLRTSTRAGSNELDGRFLVELATCKNADSGKALEWPPAPLTVRGSFASLSIAPSLEPRADRPKAQARPTLSS